MKNPVTTGSGTFGSGEEFSEFVDLSALGAVTTKGVANVPWPGNPTPRIAEVYGGMLNAIGLQNPGIDVMIERDLPMLQKAGAAVIVNVCGKSEKDYVEVVERLSDQCILPECQRRWNCLWTGPESAASYYKRSESKGEAADHYEVKSERNGHYRDGEGSSGCRNRRSVSDQYPHWNENRY